MLILVVSSISLVLPAYPHINPVVLSYVKVTNITKNMPELKHTSCIMCNITIAVHGRPLLMHQEHSDVQKFIRLGGMNPIGTMVAEYTPCDGSSVLIGVCNHCAQSSEFHKHCHLHTDSENYIKNIFARCSLRRLHESMHEKCERRNDDMLHDDVFMMERIDLRVDSIVVL